MVFIEPLEHINPEHFTAESKDKVSNINKELFDVGFINTKNEELLNELNWSEFNELRHHYDRMQEQLSSLASRRFRKVEQPKDIQNELNKIIN